MMLGVNAWRLRGRRTGVGRYLLNIVRHWTEDALASSPFSAVTLYTPAPFPEDVRLPPTVQARVLGPDVRMLVWENLRLGRSAGDDVLFCPSYTRPIAARRRTVVTTHDATLHLYPELYPGRGRRLYDELYGWSARHADLVLCPNDATGDDVAAAYRVPRSRMRVVPLAAGDEFYPRPGDPAVAEAHHRYLGTHRPFFLFVGKLSRRRNLPLLVEAVARLNTTSGYGQQLMVVGANTAEVDVGALAAEFGIARDVHQRAYVPDADLALLYNAAQAVVIPATFEAVSLPVMEAQASGTPVVSTDTGGMRETTGGAAILLARADLGHLVDALSRMAGDAGLRDELAAAGLAHSRTLSWRRCSRETLAVLSEVAA